MRESKKAKREIIFRESAFNKILSKFVKENYDNIRDIKICKGSHRHNELCFEGYVITESGKKRNISFKSIGFKLSEGNMKIKLREFGPFTESAIKDPRRVPFVLECVSHNNVILPIALKYGYRIRQKDGVYECCGRTSVRNTRNK